MIKPGIPIELDHVRKIIVRERTTAKRETHKELHETTPAMDLAPLKQLGCRLAQQPGLAPPALSSTSPHLLLRRRREEGGSCILLPQQLRRGVGCCMLGAAGGEGGREGAERSLQSLRTGTTWPYGRGAGQEP